MFPFLAKPSPFQEYRIQRFAALVDKAIVVFHATIPLSIGAAYVTKTYDAATQGRAAEQVLLHQRSVAQVARLEAGRFHLPVTLTKSGESAVLVSAAQLAMILEGIEPVARQITSYELRMMSEN